MPSIVLLELFENRLIAEYTLTPQKESEASVTAYYNFVAESGRTYVILDMSTQTVPQALKLKRQGERLEAEVSEHVVVYIDNFYAEDVVATFSLDGSWTPADEMAVTSTGTEIVADGDIIWQLEEGQSPLSPAEDDDGAGWLAWAAGALGVGVAGALITSGSSASSKEAPAEPVSLTGVAVDGYIAGATVFADANGNGQLDAGELSTTTDAAGNFTLTSADGSPILGTLISTGGIDISTGEAVEGEYRAPAGSTVISPITTLVEAVAESGGLDAEAAETLVITALGLPPGTDLNNYDPIAAATQAGASQAQVDQALQTQTAAAQINTALSLGATLLVGTGAAADNVSGQEAVSAALANSIVAGGTFDFSNATQLTDVLNDAAVESGATAAQQASVASLAADTGTMTANLGSAIQTEVDNSANQLDALVRVAAVQVVAETVENDLEASVAGGDLSSVVASTQSAVLNASVDAAREGVGEVVGASTLDTTVPTVTITDDTAATATADVTYTFLFSEDVTGFSADDVAVSGGSKGSFSAISATQYTLVVTPNANSTADITVNVAANVAQDAAGHGNIIAAQSNQTTDTAVPTVAITDDVSSTATGDVTYTFTFSEAVTGFTADDIAVNGGSKGTFSAVSATQYTLTVTADANSTTAITVDVAANVAQDAAGNDNAAAAQSSQAVDTVIPSVSITDDSASTATGDVTYTFTFSEAVTGFSAADISVAGGSKGSFVAVSATQYTLVVTPAVASTTDISVNVAANVAQDTAGNDNSAAAPSTQAVDTIIPSVVISDDTSATATGDVTYTFTFSEAVTGFTASDINVSGGNKGAFSAVSATQYTLVVTPAADSTADINVSVAANVGQDAAGNGNTAATPVVQIVDTAIPSVLITDNVSNTATGDVTYTFSFSEAVTGFTADDIAVNGASKGTFSAVSATQYTLTVTPDANSTTAITVDVAANVAQDTAGNDNNAATPSTQAVDTVIPTVVISDNTPATATGDVIYTFTFSEAITGFSVADISVAGGSKGTFTVVSATEYTLAVTPNNNSTTDISVDVDASIAQDAAGNGNIAATPSTQTVDTTIPAVTISDDTTATATGNVTYTFTFSEVVSGFSAADISVTGGSKGSFTAVSASQYTLVVTPNANSTTDITVNVAANVAQDVAGNNNTAATPSIQTVDTAIPTVSITDNISNTATGDVTYTFTFSEAVTGFTIGDVAVSGGSKGTFSAVSATQYTLIVTPDVNSTTDISVDVAANVAQDAAGNDNAAAAQSSQAVDTVIPTVSITDDSASTATGDVTYTFTFSEAVAGFNAADITVAGGSKGTFTAVSATEYTLVVTPAAASTTNISVDVAASVAQDAAGNGNIAATSSTQTVDTAIPSVTITGDSSATATGDVTYTFTFSEAVSGFSAADIGVTGGNKGNFTVISGSQYTLVVTPDANSTADITVNVAASVAQDVAGNDNTAATPSVQAVDTVIPSVSITDDTAAVATGDVTYTFTFSEAVSGFSAADITVAGGSKGVFTAISATQYTLVVTPDANSTTDISVDVAANVAQDAAGNDNTAATPSSQTVDTTIPMVVISDDTAGTAKGDVLYSFSFSEAVTGFSADDIAVGGGSKGTFTAVSATEYTLVVTPNGNSTTDITVDVAANVAQDLAGNDNGAALVSTQTVDTVVPSVTISDDTPTTATGDVTYTFTFSEAVSGFSAADISVAGGSKGSFTAISSTQYTLLVTPDANSTTDITVDVAANVAQDAAGNNNTAAQAIQTVDTAIPSVAIVNDALAMATGDVTYTFTFSEAVTGFSADDVGVSGGSKGTFTAVSATQYSLVITPDMNSTADIIVDVAANVVQDAFGNGNTAALQLSQAVDTVIPTVSITDDTAATATGDVTYTFTFSEAVSGFTPDDITVAGGSKGAFTTISATQYSLVVTPDANSTADIIVDVAANVAQDAALNGNTVATQSTQAVDTVVPAVSITSDTAGAATTDVTYTFTFTEAVTGFTADDIAISGGSKGTFTALSPNQYTLLVTPDANSTTGITVDVAANVAQDAAGNDNAAALQLTQAVDTVIPSVAISNDTLGTAIGDVTYTFAFTEAVSGFSVDDVAITGGSKGTFTAVSATQYTLVVTPDANSTADIIVNVAANVAQDAAGNNNTAAAQSSQAVDTVLPTVTITDDMTGTATADVTYTFSFSEPVTGFSADDINITAGTKGTFIAVSSTQYTLVVTPDANSTADITVDVATNVAQDAALNGNIAATQSIQAVDTAVPNVAISNDATGTATADVTYSFTFSEAVSGFSADDINVTGASKGTFTAVSPTSYTLVVTPAANSTTDIIVDVAANVAQDAAGNNNAAATQSIQTVDTAIPSVVITDNTPGIATGDVVYTFTFSENVTNFSADDITISGGSKGSFAGSGSVYTLVVSPDANSISDITVDVAANVAQDLAGNGNMIAASSVQGVNTDVTAPSVVITDNMAGSTAGDVLYTFTFSEAVSGFSAADVSITGGNKGVFTAVSSSEYTLVVTPIADGVDIVVDVAANVAQDVVGHVNTAAVQSIQEVDLGVPTVVITDNTAGTTTGVVIYTFDFSEAVTGFTVADIVVTGGDKSTFTAVSSTRYTLEVTPDANSTTNITVDVAANVAQDLVGNGNAIAAQSIQAVDTVLPTVDITNNAVGSAAGDVLYTFTFSEAVTGFAIDDVDVSGGSKGMFTAVSANQYTLVVTPDANSTTDITVDVAANVAQDLAGNDNIVATQSSQAVDTLAPTVVITDSAATTTAADVTYTFTFSEAVTGFTAADIAVTGGNKGTFSIVSPMVYTLVITPDLNSTADITVGVATNVAQDLAGNDNTAAAQSTQAVDTVMPSVAISDDTAGVATGDVTYTFTFSEDVTGFTAADIVVTGGVKGAFSGTGSVYTLVVTPDANSVANITVDVAANVAQDAVGNDNVVASQSSQSVDTMVPTVTISDDTVGAATGDITYTFIFSEAVSGFAADDIDVSGGSKGTFTTISATQYTLVVTPDANSTTDITVDVAANVAQDVSGNNNSAATQATQATDTLIPAVTIISGAAGNSAAGDVLYTFTFTEAVNGFTVDDVAVSGGNKGTFTALSPNQYTLVVTPAANSTTDITVDVAANVAQDLAGNNNTAATQSVQAVDTVAPTVAITDNTGGIATGVVTYTFTFSEAVSGFTADDVDVTGGIKGVFTSLTDSIYTLTVSPDGNSTADISVDVAASVAQDLVGNTNTAAPQSIQSVDTLVPTLGITNDVVGTAAGDVLYTFTFSENVNGFGPDDVSVAGGSKGTFTVVSNSVYTLVITPNANSTDPITVDVAANVAWDGAGNDNTAATQSLQSVDTLAPTVAITDDTAGTASGDVTYTFTFSEDVTGFTAADIAVTGGVKGTFSGSGSVYTLVVTPTANSTVDITVDVAANVAQDALANNNTAATQSVQTVDTLAPTVSITDDTLGTATGAVLYTFTFSENVTGFDIDDVTVSGAAKGTFNQISPTQYTLVVTPPANSTTDITVDVAANVAQDLLGNSNIAATQSLQSVDTMAPSVTISDDTAGTAADGVLYTFTFSEDVSGFGIGDVTVSGASKGAFNQVSPTQYTLVVTPPANSTTDITVDVAANVAQDVMGNGNTAATQAVQTVDTLAPTLDITDDTPSTATGDVTYTFTFSEGVMGFTAADVSVGGGAKGTFTAVSATQYTLVVTPNPDSTVDITVDVAASVAQDLAGNDNTVATQSVQTVDTVIPTVSITDNTAGVAIGVVIYTFSFNEAVSGFTVDDVSVTGGTIGVFSAITPSLYTLTVLPNENSTAPITIDVAAGAVQDAAGNDSAAALQAIQQVDTVVPEVTITDDVAGTTAGPVTYTFVFTENVTGFTIDDVSVVGGSKGAFTAVSTLEYTLVVIPDTNSTADITVDIPAYAVQDLAGNDNMPATQSVQAVDTAVPTLTITDDTANTATGDVLYTFTFNEDVTDFTAADVVVSNGSKGTFTVVSASEYTLVVTPNANSTADITVDVAAAVAQDAMGHSNTAATQSTQTVDTVVPTVAITDNTTPTATGDVTYTFTFSENVTDFTAADISVTGGVKGTFSGSGSVYTLVVTPNANSTTDITVNVAANVAQDAAGNDNTAAVQSVQAVDTAAPTLIISDDTVNTATGSVTYTFTFSEDVTGFTAADISATGGSKGAFSGTGSVYTLVVTPTANSTSPIIVDVAAGAAQDLLGNDSVAAAQSVQAVDTTVPSVTISDNTLATTASDVTYTFTFSEDVANFTAADVMVSGGSKGTFMAVSASEYTLVITPDANSTADITVDVAAGVAQDLAGNDNTAAAQSIQSVDTLPPTIAITDNAPGTAIGVVTYTFTFSEGVTGFSADDITVAGGSKGDFTAVTATQYTLVVTPDANSTSPITVDVAAAVAQDSMGTDNIAAPQSSQEVDTAVPTVVISDDTAGIATGDVTYTFTFSEDVTGFTLADISVVGGSAGALTAASASVYTLVVTPDASSTTDITVDVAANVAKDLAGNDNTAADPSVQTVNTVSNISGVAVDGYIAGATVFADANENGVLDNGEIFTTTDAAGNFTLDGSGSSILGTLITIGGTDIATGQAMEGEFRAAAGSTVIGPITTLVEAVGGANAEAAVLAALGLPAGIDLNNYDPIAAATAAGASPAAIAEALQVQVAAAQINTILSLGSALLTGTGSAADSVAGQAAVTAALANQVGGANSLDLSDASQLASVFQAAASESGATPAQQQQVNALAVDAGTATANLSTSIQTQVDNSTDVMDALNGVAAVQIVAESTETSIESGAGAGDISTAVTDTQGTVLDNAVTNADGQVGDLTGTSTAPTVAITDYVSGAASGDVTYLFTFSEDVSGFTVGDVSVTGGSKGIFTAVSASEYTLVVTPDANSTTDITVNVAADVAQAQDDNSNNLAATQSVQAVNTTAIELSSIASGSTSGFVINGVAASDQAGYSVSNAGDVNGDGLDDLIVGVPYADPNGVDSGAAVVVYGKSDTTVVDLSAVAAGSGGFVINGVSAGDQAGYSVSSAGDVNGDGLDDLIIGALYDDPNGSNSGSAFVVYGKSDTTAVDLSAVATGTGGFVINGVSTLDLAGRSVSSAGDVNGDGLDDLLVGAMYDDPNGDSSGAAFVIYGKNDTTAVELSAVEAGIGGFVINGVSSGDRAGWAVSNAGDVNGDGLADLIVSAPWDDPSGNSDAGASFVVYGKTDTTAVNLADVEAGTGGFVINGGAAEDYSGWSVSSAGDVNGDGLDDLTIGADWADPNGDQSGAAFVVYGKNDTTAVNLSAVAAGVGGFAINGVAASDYAGRSVSSAGDVNGDGLDDLIVGASADDPNGSGSGAAFVIYGKNDTTAVELSDVEAGSGGFVINGVAAGDSAGFSVSGGGDINGDGLADLIVAAPNDDPNGSASGAVFVVYGQAEAGSNVSLGTTGADAMNGSAAVDQLVGGAGDDTLNGNGGADVLVGGSGDDVLVIGDTSFDYLDGGSGTDTVSLGAQSLTLDLTQQSLNTQIQDIEKIDLTGGADHTLGLDGAAVREMSSANQLTIDADSGDTIQFAATDSWTQAASSSMAGYNQYSDGVSSVFITDTVGITIDGVV